MRNVLDCINAFIPLLSTEYELVLGRKGVSVTLRISFDKKDCFHLMGLQYLVDRPELSRDRGRDKHSIITINHLFKQWQEMNSLLYLIIKI